jgi:hypothetical protein
LCVGGDLKCRSHGLKWQVLVPLSPRSILHAVPRSTYSVFEQMSFVSPPKVNTTATMTAVLNRSRTWTSIPRRDRTSLWAVSWALAARAARRRRTRGVEPLKRSRAFLGAITAHGKRIRCPDDRRRSLVHDQCAINGPRCLRREFGPSLRPRCASMRKPSRTKFGESCRLKRTHGGDLIFSRNLEKVTQFAPCPISRGSRPGRIR